MIDANAAVLAWLRSSPDLAALVGTNILSPVLPPGFSTETGAKAVVVRSRGGHRHPEIQDLITPSFAIEAWAKESPDAVRIYNLISDIIHGANSVDLGSAGYIIAAQEEVFGQDIIDPATHWAMRMGYFAIDMRAGSAPVSLNPPPPIVFNFPFHWVSQNGTNAFSVQQVPRTVRGYRIFNDSIHYPIFVKLHDTASVPVAGVGISYTIGVQAGRSAQEFPVSIIFSQGLGMTIVRGIEDTDATPISASDCVVDLSYE